MVENIKIYLVNLYITNVAFETDQLNIFTTVWLYKA